MSVGGGAPADVVEVVASEVLLSEKQVNPHTLGLLLLMSTNISGIGK